ncbi:MAG TPA: hypothetical protein VNO22_06545 [Planctomycetota bacterium]|jgi:hypothetical protein|nr:hypothetical protein [Planctomycetota bacterium]
MSVPSYEEPPAHPPGFEPPTDVDVPWYAWVLWPLAIVSLLAVACALFRAFAGFFS